MILFHIYILLLSIMKINLFSYFILIKLFYLEGITRVLWEIRNTKGSIIIISCGVRFAIPFAIPFAHRIPPAFDFRELWIKYQIHYYFFHKTKLINYEFEHSWGGSTSLYVKENSNILSSLKCRLHLPKNCETLEKKNEKNIKLQEVIHSPSLSPKPWQYTRYSNGILNWLSELKEKKYRKIGRKWLLED